MNQKIQVVFKENTQTCSYQIVVGSKLSESINQEFDFVKYQDAGIYLVIDSKIKDSEFTTKIINSLKNITTKISLLFIECSEKFKSVSNLELIWNFLLENKANRKSLVVNIGGGLLCDLSGFAASTFMRGIDFIHIPTTLLSQVDASVGGKLAINLQSVKNIIGSFTQPKAVLIDTDSLNTLPQKEISSGLAEVIKHGLIYDEKFLKTLENLGEDILTPTKYNLAEVIFRSVQIKSEVVALDEKEENIRKILNFGHTAGHAFESYFMETSSHLLHGEAVALGTYFEAILAERLGFLTAENIKQVEKILTNAKLPIVLPTVIPEENFLQLILKDKKNSKGKVNWSIINKIGSCLFDVQIETNVISSVLSNFNTNVGV